MSSNPSAMALENALVVRLYQISDRVFHCQRELSSTLNVASAIRERVLALKREEAEVGNDPSTHEYQVWTKKKLELDQQRLDVKAMADDMLEEMRNLSKELMKMIREVYLSTSLI